MAANAPNSAGIAASDAEIKGKMQTAPIKQAAPIPKQTTPRPVFSTEAIVIPDPPSQSAVTTRQGQLAGF